MRYKRMDELKEGKFLIITDNGYFESYFALDRKIFKDVPNEYRILGFIQESEEVKK